MVHFKSSENIECSAGFKTFHRLRACSRYQSEQNPSQFQLPFSSWTSMLSNAHLLPLWGSMFSLPSATLVLPSAFFCIGGYNTQLLCITSLILPTYNLWFSGISSHLVLLYILIHVFSCILLLCIYLFNLKIHVFLHCI